MTGTANRCNSKICLFFLPKMELQTDLHDRFTLSHCVVCNLHDIHLQFFLVSFKQLASYLQNIDYACFQPLIRRTACLQPKGFLTLVFCEISPYNECPASSFLKITAGAGCTLNHNRFCTQPYPVGFISILGSQFLWFSFVT